MEFLDRLPTFYYIKSSLCTTAAPLANELLDLNFSSTTFGSWLFLRFDGLAAGMEFLYCEAKEFLDRPCSISESSLLIIDFLPGRNTGFLGSSGSKSFCIRSAWSICWGFPIFYTSFLDFTGIFLLTFIVSNLGSISNYLMISLLLNSGFFS